MSNIPTSPSNDRAGSRAWLNALEMTSKIDLQPQRIFPRVVEALGENFGAAPALFSPAEDFSHAQLAARVRRYARWALAQGVNKGDVVALLMPNRAEYLAIWLGITRVGGIVALINTNLGGPALAHCLAVANPRHIIADERLMPGLVETKTGVHVWQHDAGFAQAISALSDAPLEAGEGPEVTLENPALLIYTSGTTGLPKAAYVSHHRVMMWTHWFAGLMDAQADDRLYNCLPMYHSVGGVVASGAVLLKGGAVILREKFSARGFWDDVADSGATIFQYIGELCRYLLKSGAPPRAHHLRLACGNGLSGEIWEEFVTRFSGPPPLRAPGALAGEVVVADPRVSEDRRGQIQILEFYAATEGNFSLYNTEGKPGAIGRIPSFLRHRFGVALIRRGADGEPLRDASGFCQRVASGEAGEAIGRIAGGAARFEGYSDEAATAKKILRNVFETGDAYVRTGDLMRHDAQGFFYFVDRLGDTFRWKGENVATTEVAAALSAYPGINVANVYGVAVPGADGKAGMAALETDAGFDPVGLKSHLKTRLPDYAHPIFLRLVGTLALTETFKQKKSDLASDGFDPARVPDPLYIDLGDGYVPFDAALYERVRSGLVRL
jgi:fatty-acyl-CoA synthase